MSALAAVVLSVLAIGSSDTSSSSSSSSAPAATRNTSSSPSRQAPVKPQASQTGSQGRKSTSITEQKSSNQESATGITLKGFYVATTEETYLKARKLLAQGDKDSFHQLSKAKQIASLPEGKSAEITGARLAHGLVQIRLEGFAGQYWTSSNAIQLVSKEESELAVEASVSLDENESASKGVESNNVSNTEEYANGYESGFIVGEAMHNQGEPAPSPQRLDLLSRYIVKEPNGYPHYKKGYLKGFADGFAGLARGGTPRPDLPKLPFKETGYRNMAVISLGSIVAQQGEKKLVKEIAGLLRKKPQADLFVVTARWKVGEAYVDHVRLIYDSKRKCLVYLSRSRHPYPFDASDDHYSWRVFFDVTPNDFSQGIPWGNDSIRRIGDRPDNKKISPLQYAKNPEVTEFP